MMQRTTTLVAVLMAITTFESVSFGAGASCGEEFRQWREKREAGLRADDGWLTVTGLFWLHQGANRVGTGSSNDALLPQGSVPASIGTVTLEAAKVSFAPEPSSGGLRPGEFSRCDVVGSETASPKSRSESTATTSTFRRVGNRFVRPRCRSISAMSF
jgi:hypothetical protein